MLLLLKGTSATLTASIIGIGSVVASGSTVSASIMGTGIFIAPNSIESLTSASCMGTGVVVAFSQGLIGRTAFVDGGGFVNAVGGFGANATVLGTGLVSATVGSFFDGGNVSLTGTGVVTVSGAFSNASTIMGTGSVVAVPIISGGTISTAAQAMGTGIFSVTFPLYVESASLIGHGIVTAIPSTSVLNLATDMRLSFESDEIRLFFRKG